MRVLVIPCTSYNFHFIPAKSMRMQIPVGRMSFCLAKASNAIWSSVIMLYLAGKPRLCLSLSQQCQPPMQNSLLFVLALLMSRIAAKLPMNLAFCNYALLLSTKIILARKAIAENANFKGRSQHFELRWRFLHQHNNRCVVTIKAIKLDLLAC